MTWLDQNALALYGAITGTVALFISFFSHRHNVKKDRIRLVVSFAPHPKADENIMRMNTADPNSLWARPQLAEIYSVTVRNMGGVSAPLDDVGLTDEVGKDHQALVHSRSGQMNFLVPLSKSNAEALEPRAAKTFSVYLNSDAPMFKVASAYAVDQTGKVWRARA